MKIKIIILTIALALIKENSTYNIPEIMECNSTTCWINENNR